MKNDCRWCNKKLGEIITTTKEKNQCEREREKWLNSMKSTDTMQHTIANKDQRKFMTALAIIKHEVYSHSLDSCKWIDKWIVKWLWEKHERERRAGRRWEMRSWYYIHTNTHRKKRELFQASLRYQLKMALKLISNELRVRFSRCTSLLIAIW